MLDRALKTIMEKGFSRQKVTVLLGSRRTGKTALLKMIRDSSDRKILYLNGESVETHQLLEERSISNYRRLLQGVELLLLDEAQYIPDYGRKIKLMIDEMEPLHIVITGSSAFGLQEKGEPLVGRTLTYQLFPVAQLELQKVENPLDTLQNLPDRLLYGSYPEVLYLNDAGEKKQYLHELVSTYLLKDIFAFEHIRQPQKLKDLLRLIAWQIGHDVSVDELSRQLGISKPTVERYLDILSQVFIIYKRSGYSNNLRKEVTKSSRWYFYDNGVRNAVISNFQTLPLRQDVGALWENYILAERMKRNAYRQEYVNSYFWRTYDGQEIDLIEEQDGSIRAYECKWKEQKTRTPVAFAKAYPDAPFQVVHSGNYLGFIT